MRPLLSAGLILTLTLPFIGVWQFFSIQLRQVRQEAKDLMDQAHPAETNVYFEFTLSETKTILKWEHEREFEYRGEMYDVICQEILDGKIRYWCYWDRKETVLKNEFHKFVANAFSGENRDHKNETHISVFLKTLFYNSINTLPQVNDYVHTTGLTKWVNLLFPNVYITPPSHPPETAV